MTKENPDPPRVFISYSWSSPEHEEWVVQLATRLMSHGVQVSLDKWDLSEGQDKYAYMERMAAEPSITRVLVISDRIYAEKADGRSGGVGTETQILSREVYEKVDQRKVVACITERDERGEPYLPTFLKNRIYIDFSDPTKEAEEYEKLIRNIWNKPAYARPELGKPPAYLSDDVGEALLTSTLLADVRDALARARPHARGALTDLALKFVEAYEREKLPIPVKGSLTSNVLSSIDRFLPYRDEFIELVFLLVRYSREPEHYRRLHAIFEGMLQVQETLAEIGGLQDEWRDNLKFISWEFMLYAVSILANAEFFEQANLLLQPTLLQTYRLPRPVLVSFTQFETSMGSLDESEGRRMASNEVPGSVMLLRKRATNARVTFRDVQQADALLFARSVLVEQERGRWWYPRTLSSAENQVTFPAFVRAESGEYFERLKVLLGCSSKQEILRHFEQVSAGEDFPNIPRFWGGADRYKRLVNLDALSSRP